MKPVYLPSHPFDPEPPTFLNRLTCKLAGHLDHLSHFDLPTRSAHLICTRCSRYLVLANPTATLPDQNRAIEH